MTRPLNELGVADLGRALAQWMPKAPARRLRKRPSPP